MQPIYNLKNVSSHRSTENDVKNLLTLNRCNSNNNPEYDIQVIIFNSLALVNIFLIQSVVNWYISAVVI